MVTYKFLLRDRIKLNGLFPLIICFTKNRVKKYYTTGIELPGDAWSVQKSLVINHPYKDEYNTIISNYIKNIEKIKIDSWITNNDIDLIEFISRVKASNYNSFLTWALAELKTLDITPNTRASYLSQLNKIEGLAPNLTFSDFNEAFVLRYQKYCIDVLGNNRNTLGKSLGILRFFCRRAVDKGLITQYPFKNIKITRLEGNRDFLSIEELKAIENLSGLSDRHETIRKYFLFACYTGLRWSDVIKLRYSDIKNNIIHVQMHKTKLMVAIPLQNKAVDLVGSGSGNRLIFKTYTSQPTNRILKEIGKKANIDKHITFHVARHTFATMAISIGIPVEVVSKLLGHTNIKQTMIYAKILTDVRVKYIDLFNHV